MAVTGCVWNVRCELYGCAWCVMSVCGICECVWVCTECGV